MVRGRQPHIGSGDPVSQNQLNDLVRSGVMLRGLNVKRPLTKRVTAGGVVIGINLPYQLPGSGGGASGGLRVQRFIVESWVAAQVLQGLPENGLSVPARRVKDDGTVDNEPGIELIARPWVLRTREDWTHHGINYGRTLPGQEEQQESQARVAYDPNDPTGFEFHRMIPAWELGDYIYAVPVDDILRQEDAADQPMGVNEQGDPDADPPIPPGGVDRIRVNWLDINLDGRMWAWVKPEETVPG